jgi:hypothetical protein
VPLLLLELRKFRALLLPQLYFGRPNRVLKKMFALAYGSDV